MHTSGAVRRLASARALALELEELARAVRRSGRYTDRVETLIDVLRTQATALALSLDYLLDVSRELEEGDQASLARELEALPERKILVAQEHVDRHSADDDAADHERLFEYVFGRGRV